jgi:hypothetical protein
LISGSSEVVCGRLDLLVDGLGRDFFRLLWGALEIVVDCLRGRLEWIWDLGFNGVETLDRITVCEGEVGLRRRMGTDRG